ncbi:MAG: HlyD family efflux transporter periplasmic adaptor subunit [Litoreibacter sp.]|nr:HlyD family efflux transporter periplasmic adaptor subunit [Litoreibacter sp.]MCY4335537.1 HlyD family efflux transporter periplasmic adaptor subunit [Litoreibacter sp.]
MRFFGRSLTGLFLLSLTLGFLTLAGNSVYSALQASWAEEDRQRPARERVFTVAVSTLEPGDVTPHLQSFGEIRSRRTLDLRAPTEGRIVELAENFEEGATVREGQFLARIDPSEAQAALDVAQTDLLEARADLIEAERAILLAQDELQSAQEQVELRARALDRQRDLLNRDVGTTAAVEQAELSASTAQQSVLSRRQALQTAEARLEQTKTLITRREIALRDAERKLSETEVFAKFDGRLSEVAVTSGGLVANNERLAQLVDPDALEVAFRVSTSQHARLIDEAGRLTERPVEIRLEVLGTDLVTTGKLTRESAGVSEGTIGRLLFAEVDSASGLRPGDFVTVRVEEPILRRVVRLPATAISADNTVLIVNTEERLEAAQVDLLRRQGDDVIVRARGLAGREVVLERSQNLGAGIKVNPQRGEAGDVPDAPEMVELDDERRARMIAFVEANTRIPDEVKTRMLGQLQEAKVPARMVERLESRMGS